jgi:hypothetical protein
MSRGDRVALDGSVDRPPTGSLSGGKCLHDQRMASQPRCRRRHAGGRRIVMEGTRYAATAQPPLASSSCRKACCLPVSWRRDMGMHHAVRDAMLTANRLISAATLTWVPVEVTEGVSLNPG